MPFFKNQFVKYQGHKGKLTQREGDDWIVDFIETWFDNNNNPMKLLRLPEDHLQHWTKEDDKLSDRMDKARKIHEEFTTLSHTWNTYLLKIEEVPAPQKENLPANWCAYPKDFKGKPGDPRPLQVQWDTLPILYDLCFVLAASLEEAMALAKKELHLLDSETISLVHEFPLETPLRTAFLAFNQRYRDFDIATDRHWLHPQNIRVFAIDH